MLFEWLSGAGRAVADDDPTDIEGKCVLVTPGEIAGACVGAGVGTGLSEGTFRNVDVGCAAGG